jgi:hypothetical protein
MLKLLVPLAAAIASVIAGVALAGSAASTYTYRSSMTTGGETPKPKGAARAKGVFTATVTESGSTRTIAWKLTFSGLSGKAMAAHIHKGKPGVAGAVIVPLCGPCKSGQTGKVKITKNVADALEHGLSYVNVHTAKNMAGEIRGQVRFTGHSGDDGAGSSNGPATTAPTITDPMPDPGGGYGQGY